MDPVHEPPRAGPIMLWYWTAEVKGCKSQSAFIGIHQWSLAGCEYWGWEPIDEKCNGVYISCIQLHNKNKYKCFVERTPIGYLGYMTVDHQWSLWLVLSIGGCFDPIDGLVIEAWVYLGRRETNFCLIFMQCNNWCGAK